MLDRRLVRFLLVGLLNTGFSFSLYLLLVWLGWHYAVANLLATSAGIVFSFRTNGAWVFANRDWRLMLRFAPMWAVVYVVNVALIAWLTHLGAGPYLGGILALPPTVALSYLLQKKLVFNVDTPSNDQLLKP